ncbi:hypothetical protein HMPREF0307_00678 [Corynebacterium sp. DNF00584]|nr:hypothetical protein HMPREF0307_00678 [Corynebacterium sp. DNF00584]
MRIKYSVFNPTIGARPRSHYLSFVRQGTELSDAPIPRPHV